MGFTFSGFVHVTVIFLFCAATLGLAISFAVRPTEKKLGILRPISLATLFSILAGIAAGIGATALHASLLATTSSQSEIPNRILSGLAEAMVPPVFGFAVLAVSWLLAAVGLRRQN
jgi:hypothetical protein